MSYERCFVPASCGASAACAGEAAAFSRLLVVVAMLLCASFAAPAPVMAMVVQAAPDRLKSFFDLGPQTSVAVDGELIL